MFAYSVLLAFQDEVPATMMDAHLKNVEKTSFGGKFDPYAGLATSGIAGTDSDKDKDDEEGKLPGAASTPGISAASGSTDVEMKDASKKDDGEFLTTNICKCCRLLPNLAVWVSFIKHLSAFKVFIS